MKLKTCININKKKSYIKPLMLFLVIVIGYSIDITLAANGDSKYMEEFASLMNSLMNLASRIRIPIATLAGKFMSNEMIYGSRLHLDKYLWQIWNITKNFANFGLVGLLLYEIGKSVMKKGGGSGDMVKIIKNAVVAGILIQMSWFLVGAVIDISTIATTAVASFPATFLGNSAAGEAMNRTIQQTIEKEHIILDNKMVAKKDTSTNPENTEHIKSQLMPRYDSVGGTLVFIGGSVLKVQETMTNNVGAKNDAKSLLITFGLKGIIFVFYIIILILLLIANVMRVGFLWIFIAISPLIVLLGVFFDQKTGLGKEGFSKDLNLGNFISIVFKPTIFVGILGIILVFTTTIQSVLLKENPPEFNGVKITGNGQDGTKVEIDGISSVITSENILGTAEDTAKSIIPNFIVYLATIFLLWLLVKVALSSGGDGISKFMKTSTEFIEKGARQIPIANGLGYDKMKEKAEKMRRGTTNTLAKEYFGKETSFDSRSGIFENSAFDAKVNEITRSRTEWREKDFLNLGEVINTKDSNFIDATKNIINTKGHEELTGTMRNYTQWEEMFKKWIAKKKEVTGLSQEYKEPSEITNSKDWELIHTTLGGELKDIPKNYEEFKKLKYGGTEVRE